MKTEFSVDLLKPSALGTAERAAWRAMVRASPALRSPYFSLEYALAADGVAPGATVAVIHRGGSIAGFLPFQKRGRVAQPLGAPLSDYHGLISAPGEAIDLPTVLRLARVRGYRFGGLVAPEPPKGARCVAHPAMRSNVGGGLDAWLAARPPGARKYFKDKERSARVTERELGPVEFRMDDDAPGVLEFVIASKREQYRRTGRHDIFACGWTERFLHRLWKERTAEFGGRIATLRAGGVLLAAEFGLRAGPVRHIWFPAYDPAHARLGAGSQLMIATMKAAAVDPTLSEVDFGREGGDYKKYYAAPSEVVYEGSLDLGGWRAASARVADATLVAPGLGALAEVRERMRRRFEIITACETETSAWLGGAAVAFRDASRRGPATSAG